MPLYEIGNPSFPRSLLILMNVKLVSEGGVSLHGSIPCSRSCSARTTCDNRYPPGPPWEVGETGVKGRDNWTRLRGVPYPVHTHIPLRSCRGPCTVCALSQSRYMRKRTSESIRREGADSLSGKTVGEEGEGTRDPQYSLEETPEDLVNVSEVRVRGEVG